MMLGEPVAVVFALIGAYLVTEDGWELAGFFAFMAADVLWAVHFSLTGQTWPLIQFILFTLLAGKGVIKHLTPLPVEVNNGTKVGEP